MRLGLRLLSPESTINNLMYIDELRMVRGETQTILLQLVDIDQKKQRYIPQSGCAVNITIPRLAETIPIPGTLREVDDYTVNRGATQPFADDRSIWSLTFSTVESQNMISNSVRATLNESNGATRIASLMNAIKVIDWNDG